MIGFIGFGMMGEAFARAISSQVTDNIIVFDKSFERLDIASNKYGFKIVRRIDEIFEVSSIIVIAVKPQSLGDLEEYFRSHDFKGKTVITMVAGIRSSYYVERFGLDRLVRIMPNVTVTVGSGAIAVSFIGSFNREEIDEILRLLSAVGKVVTVDESLMDAVTGLSGSGPAFVAIILEAFVDAGVRVGLPRDVSKSLVLSTFRGVIEMIEKLGLSTREVVEMVTSPGGTTIAGIHALERGGLRGIIMNTVFEAYNRSKELGGTGGR
ncbi:MAG: pyrroline-5-carboxylate reductase [Thermosulfidibacteraceae bacterium]|jgi:pyrroline-5-carboxylate reductase